VGSPRQSKVDLVKALVIGYRAAAEEGLGKLEEGIPDAVERLRTYVQYWKTCIGDASAPFCVCTLLASERLASVLERGVQQKLVSLRNEPEVEAEAFMATVHGAIMDPQLERLSAKR